MFPLGSESLVRNISKEKPPLLLGPNNISHGKKQVFTRNKIGTILMHKPTDPSIYSVPISGSGTRGETCSNSRPQPPPPDPPKVFEPVFLQFETLGERVGAKGAENFFCPS